MKRKMHLVAYLKTGPTALHPGGWRHPDATLHDIFEPDRYEHIARVLENACFDGCFFADLFGLYDIHKGGFDTYVERGGQISFLDPMTVLPIMARATSRLGLGATLSTTLFNPYHLARSLLSLDVLSKGRMSWNMVTSATNLEAQNFGLSELPEKDQRYDQADEVLEACMLLWKSWDRDAFVMDKTTGIFADPSKVHYANYQGRYANSRGPLSIPQSLQGHPVLMQAGSSERGRQFAARWAEIVFTSQSSKEHMQAFYEDVKNRLSSFGRSRQDCAILAQVSCVVGETDSIAREKADFLQSCSQKELSLAAASSSLGVDMSQYKEGDDITSRQGSQGIQGSVDTLNQLKASAGGTTLEAARQLTGNLLVGSATTIADQLEDLFNSGSCDGFIVAPAVFPSSHEAFCRSVVPELQRRSLFRTSYEGRTLREHIRSEV